MTRRRGWSLTEVMLVIGTFTVLMTAVMPAALSLSTHHAELTARADDLRRAVEVVDRVTRDVRTATVVEPWTPGGRLRTGTTTLVLRLADGRYVAWALEGGPRARLVRAELDRDGLTRSREDVGHVGTLGFRFDPPRAGAARAVSIDVTLPPRTARAAPPALSTRALVGAGEERP